VTKDASALPSWRGLLFGVLALAGVCLLFALIVSKGLEPRVEPAPSRPAPPPALEPPAAWQSVASIVGDPQAVSALLLAFDGKWMEANPHLFAMLKLPPAGDIRAARAGNETGLAHLGKGELAQALQAFDVASRADRRDVEVANNLGYAYLKAGKAREAVPPIMHSLHLDPARSSAWINLAEALAELGYEDPSVAALLLALRYSPNRDGTRAFLGDAARSHASMAFRKQVARALAR